MSKSLKLNGSDHGVWTLVQNRVAQGWPMQAIADEVGWDVRELCDWVLGYKPPPRQRFPQHRVSPSSLLTKADRDDLSIAEKARRFSNWQKAQQGAAARLDAIALETSGKSQ
ncbi:MAG: hypothetical protein WC829_02185 [Hyphomicrobium sp.]